MVASIQFQSSSLSVANAEPFNPDQGVVFTGQIFSSLLQISETPDLLLSQITENDSIVRKVQGSLAVLFDRQRQSGSPATPEAIKAAIKNGMPLESIFASDPENLGIDLAQSTMQVEVLEKAGLTIDADLYYPVVTISTDENNQQVESLVWMTAAERLALDRYPITEEKDYAPYLAREETERNQVTHYVFLDDQANLRIDPNALNDAISQINKFIFQKKSSITVDLVRISNELAGISLLLDWLTHTMEAGLKSKNQAIDLKGMKAEEETQSEYARLAQVARFRLDIKYMDKVKEDMLLNSEKYNG